MLHLNTSGQVTQTDLTVRAGIIFPSVSTHMPQMIKTFIQAILG